MDRSLAAQRPQSLIGTASRTLLTTLHSVSADVTSFVRRCRSARTDLAPLTRELSELQMVLQHLADLAAQNGVGAVPDTLQAHLGPIITNCVAIVAKVRDVLRRQQVAGWTVEARDEVGGLAKLLGAHRGVMGLMGDLISIVVVSRGASIGEQERKHVAVLLGELRALGSDLVVSYSNAALAREHFVLQAHLGQIVSYAETLARTDLWQDAVRTLDEAQQREESRDHQQQQQRQHSADGSHSADRHLAAAEIRNSGLENLLQLGDLETYDPNRPPSMFFTPNTNTNTQAQEVKPAATAESAGPSGTGFIVMDGFVNSAHSGAATVPGVSYQGGQEHRQPRKNLAGIERRSPLSSRRSFEYQNAAERSMTREDPAHTQATPLPLQARVSAAGLQLQIPSEKELAVEDRISDEALAFAQVPIHVLDRLSVNLVGHVYGASPTDNPSHAQAAAFQSSSAIRTTNHEDVDAGDRSDAASSSTANTGGLRDSSLQFSQMDLAKVPSAPPATSHPHSQATPRSHTPVGFHHHQQQPLQYSSSSTHHQPPYQTSPSHAAAASQAAPQQSPDPSTTTVASSRTSFTSARSAPNLPSHHQRFSPSAGHSGLREVDSMSTMQTLGGTRLPYDVSQKPLPRAPLVYIPGYPGPFIKKKVVVVGNFSCGKTCLIT